MNNSPKKYPKWFYLILIFIPILLVVATEILLRVIDYGVNLDQWIEATSKHYMLNDKIAYRYFYNTKSVPYSAGDIFEKEKSPGTIRIFVMGASSAAGYPFTPGGAFSKYVRKRLQLIFPSKNIEVVNLAFAAVNTYTIRDLFPGVLEHEPDLILIYAGHNEYYGALGAGSTESLGSNRDVVNFVLTLNTFKITQLTRDVIKSVIDLFSPGEKPSGTLMSRMAKEQSIPLDSEIYKNGIEQFRGNLSDILNMAKEAEVPVILSDLVSNLKDQKPFISINDSKQPPASEIYNTARQKYDNGNYREAERFFRKAKELDALRFRAPEELNKIIHELGNRYNYSIIKIDSVFNALSENGIVGNNLLTDHLHPTVHGYQIIGKLFTEEILRGNFLPEIESELNYAQQDSIVISNFSFTEIDSTLGRYRIIILKSDWPYVEKSKSVQKTLREINLKTFIDSTALKVVDDKISWERAHRMAAKYYISNGYVNKFKEEMNTVIDQYPLITEYYKSASQELLNKKMYDDAYFYLEEYYKRTPDAFSSKWLGIIDLSKNKIASAIKYLEESVKFNLRDAQTLYNLAGAYSLNKEYRESLETINNCLRVSPDFPGAKNLKAQLMQILQPGR